MRVLWTDAAIAQLQAIHDYLAQTSPDYAVRIIDRLSVMRINKITNSFILVLVLAAAGNSQQSTKAFSPARGSENQGESTSYEFSTNGYRYHISHQGKGRKTSSDETAQSFNLRLDKHYYLTGALYYEEDKGDLLLIGEVSDEDYGSGFIVRIDGRSLKTKWKQIIPGFNVGQGLIDANNAYVTAIGFVGKVSLESGSFLWRHKNLYRRDNSAFNSFETPQVDGDAVVFRESSHYLRPSWP